DRALPQALGRREAAEAGPHDHHAVPSHRATHGRTVRGRRFHGVHLTAARNPGRGYFLRPQVVTALPAAAGFFDDVLDPDVAFDLVDERVPDALSPLPEPDRDGAGSGAGMRKRATPPATAAATAATAAPAVTARSSQY